MKRGSKLVGHSTEIIRQSKIKGPLKRQNEHNLFFTSRIQNYQLSDTAISDLMGRIGHLL